MSHVNIPPALVRFLVKWGIRKTGNVFVPECGDGRLLKGAVQMRLAHSIPLDRIVNRMIGTESDPDLAREARKTGARIFEESFLEMGIRNYDKKQFASVLLHPDPNEGQGIGEAGSFIRSVCPEAELQTRWTAVLFLAMSMVQENGFLGAVVPQEILNVSHAGWLRNRLMEEFSSVTIVRFASPILEPDDSQNNVLLLARKGAAEKGLKIVDADAPSVLDQISPADLLQSEAAVDFWPEFPTWNYGFLNTEELALVQKIGAMEKIVTGFQLYTAYLGDKLPYRDLGKLTVRNVIEHHLRGQTIPFLFLCRYAESLYTSLISRSLRECYRPCYLLAPREVPLPVEIMKTYPDGEKAEISKAAEKLSVYARTCPVYDFLVPKNSMYLPFFISNDGGMRAADNFIGIMLTENSSPYDLLYGSLNWFTAIAIELVSAIHYGSMISLTESTCELIPMIHLSDSTLTQVQDMSPDIRDKRDIYRVIEEVGEITLSEELGLKEEETGLLRKIFWKLKGRREFCRN